MANHKETTPVKALVTTTQAQHSGGGGTAVLALGRGALGRFTAEELVAAQQLVQLSESSSEDVAPRAASSASSSSIPSVGNARPPAPASTMAEEEEEEGMATGPRVCRPRYRGICSLYAATLPIGAVRKEAGAAQSRKKGRR